MELIRTPAFMGHSLSYQHCKVQGCLCVTVRFMHTNLPNHVLVYLMHFVLMKHGSSKQDSTENCYQLSKWSEAISTIVTEHLYISANESIQGKSDFVTK